MGSSDRQEQFQVEWNEERAWRAVKRELSDLTGGSGHLSSYILDRDTFEITADGPSRFTWAVTGYLLTEFDHDLPPESLHGILSFHDDGEDVARAIREKE